MGWRREQVTREEFFAEENRNGMSEEDFAIRIYVAVHTMYLKNLGKTKPEFGKFWQNLTGKYMTDAIFEYIYQNEPILTMDNLVAEVNAGKEIKSMKYIVKTLVALEFDLWLVERYKDGKELKLTYFANYLNEKYGAFTDIQYTAFRKFDLYNIYSFEAIAKELAPYREKIDAFFEKLCTTNKMRITIDDIDVKRTKEYKPAIESKPPIQKSDEQALRQKIERENQIILQEKQERIEKLERDIKEFKRQRDEAKEYSINQYDKGVKDLFALMNDARYGKVIDYLFSLTVSEGVDENLASYLENFFMLLEDMEIEPIAEYDDEVIDDSNLTKNYNLDFDKNEYVSGKAKIKYVGWKYKDVTIEKPTLTLIRKN